MTPRYYHTPPPPISTRPRCPVCHETVYSPAGIHPQCAVRQADPPRPKAKPPRAGSPADLPSATPEPAGAKVVGEPSGTSGRSAPAEAPRDRPPADRRGRGRLAR